MLELHQLLSVSLEPVLENVQLHNCLEALVQVGDLPFLKCLVNVVGPDPILDAGVLVPYRYWSTKQDVKVFYRVTHVIYLRSWIKLLVFEWLGQLAPIRHQKLFVALPERIHLFNIPDESHDIAVISLIRIDLQYLSDPHLEQNSVKGIGNHAFDVVDLAVSKKLLHIFLPL